MQSNAWKFALSRVPREHHSILLLVTTIGIEIYVNNIQLLEDDYVVLRGRLGGTTDSGRVFFVPYDQINYLTFTREMKEDQVEQLLGIDGESQPAAPSAVASVQVEPANLASTILPPPPPPPVVPVAKPSPPSKLALLERIRMRNRPKPPPGGQPAPPAPNK